ncbi:flagellar motor switch protein FliM [Methylovirgula sp. HY1]|uniref:flagellar motor switch protein FliM n=1 Tax=Methylovirgula sp. HY1 TaxID=2822761 RepID=UPI001C5B475D|nr:FliM/FliN family flagellar motor switch protein [Methylovirgula sp. HY1]QXX74724.1 Flagellar motor switch protein FliM [Methylovirgula sp. HY1]
MEVNSQTELRREGSEPLLDTAGISVERMPMLHVIFDRMTTQCSEALRQLSSAPAYVTVNSMKTERIGNILESYDGRAAVAVLQAQSWDARVMFGLDNGLVFTLVEALFGGDGTEMPYSESRPLTNIELRFAQKMLDLVSRALQVCFSSVIETRFKFERLETRMDFAVIAPRNSFAVITRINIRMLGRSGELFIVIPQAALTPIRQNLSRDLTNEVSIPDPAWTKHIQSEVGRAEVTVRAVIEEQGFTLGDIADLQVGAILELQATSHSRVRLEGNAEPLFWCQLGQSDGKYTLRIEDPVDTEQEFLDDLLGR